MGCLQGAPEVFCSFLCFCCFFAKNNVFFNSLQKHMFHLLEHVMVDLNYVPIPELTGLGLLLQKTE